MDKIYIVMGTRGEYSERDEWLEMAFISEKKAQEHVIKKAGKAREAWIQVNGNNPRDIKAAKESHEIPSFYYEAIKLVK